ncbi:hypothetical protein TorRG33x02_008850 [Trema orientale]|uniref:Uncharacterized protein n=1 Tax=Trema orientale TaxID=63057 RepID=A0A2P5G0V2_TREOI|nr:hypothetical protein TorRG33x02_008850 [Trema orientale]
MDELFNLETVLAVDPKEHHYKGLLTNLSMASSRVERSLLEGIHLEVEGTFATVQEAMMPLLLSSSTGSPCSIVLGMTYSSHREERDCEHRSKKKSDHHRSHARDQDERPPVEDRPLVEDPPVAPRVFPPRVTPFSQPRPGTPTSSKRCTGSPLVQ